MLAGVAPETNRTPRSVAHGVAAPLQGDLEMYEPRNIAARRALRTHPAIIYIIELFWSCVDLHKDASGCVSEPEYIRMSVKLQKVRRERGARGLRTACSAALD